MDAFLQMLINVLMFVALALPGYILIKAKLLNSSQSNALSTLLAYVGLPFLVVSSTLNINFDGQFLTIALISLGVGIAITFLMFFLSKLLTVKEKEEKTRGMMRFAMTFSNNGFLGIPLAIAVFGTESIVPAIVIVLNIINNILIFILGTYLASGGDKSAISIKKALVSPVLIAFFVGLALNLLDVGTHAPVIVDFSEHLKNIVTPLSMIVLGIKLADIPIKSLFTSKKCYYVSVVKLILFPVIAVAIGFAMQSIPGLGKDFILAMFISFAMPTAGLAATLADKYDGDSENSVVFTLGTTILSILTIPLLYLLLTSII